jgi:hypothetical protein
MNPAIGLMFADYRRSFKLKWGRVLHQGPAALEEKLAVEARRFNCRLETDGQDFLWRNDQNETEALFRFVDDPSDLRSFRDIYARLAEVGSPVTYVIVHQRADGEGNYDVFRLSTASYLEHNNRLRYR